ALMREWVDELVVVSEDAVAEAMVSMLERAKLVAEGAGAVGAPALLGRRVTPPPDAPTASVLSRRNLHPGRRATAAPPPAAPAGPATLLELVGRLRANLLDIPHLREGLDLHVRESAVQLVLETRGRAHAEEVLAAIRAAGYDLRTLA